MRKSFTRFATKQSNHGSSTNYTSCLYIPVKKIIHFFMHEYPHLETRHFTSQTHSQNRIFKAFKKS